MTRRAAPARSSHVTLHRALDVARFGPVRTLDLRSTLPTANEAVRRAEPWLRERQMARAGTVLIITGRGRGSAGGVAVVRPAIERLLATLRRKGVVSRVTQHTAGSFEVVLAPIRALFETLPRSRRRDLAEPLATPAALDGLDSGTRRRLRTIAERSLDNLGAPRTEPFVADEMLRQFAILSSAIASDETDRESRLRFLIDAAGDAFDEG